MLFSCHKLSLPFHHFFLIIGVFFLGGLHRTIFSLFLLGFFFVIVFWCVFVSGAGSCVCLCVCVCVCVCVFGSEKGALVLTSNFEVEQLSRRLGEQRGGGRRV
jgi:hypothetical protein